MVIREYFSSWQDSTKLYKHYSDQGLVLLQNETGLMYPEAIDVEFAPYTYSETDIPVDVEEEEILDEINENGNN